ncbi:hypothetical protein V7S43_017071 [Phytophthora oleae]|uniref:Ubiquitin-like protease family profile domain-containing protein n=1 Tax=Phytophthora oleae TaxID=2107226 RepID=A0ABD3EY08_9STRA
MKVLPLSNTSEQAIALYDEADTQKAQKKASEDNLTETGIIKEVECFSRKQIETFKRIQNLKTAVQLGLDMHKWLMEESLPALPAEYHASAKQVADEVLKTYPYTQLPGLPNIQDFQFVLLYRATPPTWLSDAAIRALFTKSKKTRSTDLNQVEESTLNRMLHQVGERGVDVVMLPLNFGNAHWCCVVVRVKAKRIFYYDPLNQSAYLQPAGDIAKHIKIRGLYGYDVLPETNPIQFDAFSCGVYVCWNFIRQAGAGTPVDMSVNSLPRRRFELFYYLLTGHLLTKDGSATAADDDEEKIPVPQDEDDVPQTQIAQ